MKDVVPSILVAFMLFILFVPRVASQNGPEIDAIRYWEIPGPNLQRVEMELNEVDVLTQRMNPIDIQDFYDNGYTVTSTSGFHMCFVGFNIRSDQSYRRPGITYWPLADADFRHALAHSIDKDGITSQNSVMSTMNSMVPMSLKKYYNPDINPHKFWLGDPFASSPGEHSTCGILLDADYSFVDADLSGDVSSMDYWLMPNMIPVPTLQVMSPLLLVDPWTCEDVIETWLADCSSIGLVGTINNGSSGLMQVQLPLWACANAVYNLVDFDIFVINFKLNRHPDYLYDWFHSSQDSKAFPWAYNPFGLNDSSLDGLLEMLRYSLFDEDKRVACNDVQEWLADPSNSQGLPVIPILTMRYFDVFGPNRIDETLRGVVRSPGYGAGAGGCVSLREPRGLEPSIWTYTNMRWPLGEGRLDDVDDDNIFETVVHWCLSDFHEPLSPLAAGTSTAWEIMNRVFDPLITLNPYNHNDILWIATDWTLELTDTGMNVTYNLRDDVYWADGYQYTAFDAAFNLEFIRDWQVNKYKPVCEAISDVEVHSPTCLTVISDVQCFQLLYDWAVLATLLPPQIWDRAWPSQAAVLAYIPDAFAYGTDMAPGYSAGPWASEVPTNLFGTGPFIYQFYDSVAFFSEMWKNENYFMSTTDMHDLKIQLFYEVGDVNMDGIVNVFDQTIISFAFGSIVGEPEYDPFADLNKDGIVDMRDLRICASHLLWQKEYPGEY